MKSIFDRAVTQELVLRIDSLSESSKAQWGKMNVYQMLKHCSRWEDMMWGRLKCKRVWLGYLFGRLALTQTLKDETPMSRHSPTSRELRVTESQGDVAAEKATWIAQVREHDHFPDADFVHPFFGRMTKEQLGYFAYKHIDHHLRQFNQ